MEAQSKCADRAFVVSTQRVKNGGRGASGRRGDRPTYSTVLEPTWERVRYGSAPGCPGRRRASCALTDLHTNSRPRRSAGTHNCTLLYNYDAQPPRATGDLPGMHNRTGLRRRIDAGGPLAGPPSRPGAQTTLTCCSGEPLQSSFCGIMGGLSTLRLSGLRSTHAVCVLRLVIILPHLCKKPGQKIPRGSLSAHGVPGDLAPPTLTTAAPPNSACFSRIIPNLVSLFFLFLHFG